MSTDKTTKKSSKPASTTVGAASQTKFNLNDAVAAAAALVGQSSAGAKGAVYTKQEADYTVQNVYQQLLGRNANGNEYAKALSIAMGQSQDTSNYGRAQAVINYVQKTPEFQMELENKYMDAIYKELGNQVQKSRGV